MATPASSVRAAGGGRSSAGVSEAEGPSTRSRRDKAADVDKTVEV